MKKILPLFIFPLLMSCHPQKEEYVNKARLLLQSGEYDQCITITDEAIQHYPEDASLHNFRGVAFFEKGEFKKAISSFDASTEKDSTDYRPLYNMGNCYFEMKEYAQAIESFKQAIDLNPKGTELYVNLGNAYFESGKYDQAHHQFDFALKLDSASYLANLNLARTMIAIENFESAIPHLKECIQLEPNKGESYYFLAYASYLSEKEASEYCLLLQQSKELGYQPVGDNFTQLCEQ